MTILVNGEPRRVLPGATVSDLIALLELRPEHVAVERNRELVPRAQHRQTELAEGDAVEVVTLVGGGSGDGLVESFPVGRFTFRNRLFVAPASTRRST